MEYTADCGRCRAQREDALHIVRDCKASMEVWRGLVAQNDQSTFFLPGLRVIGLELEKEGKIGPG